MTLYNALAASSNIYVVAARQRPHQIQMKVGKSSGRNRNSQDEGFQVRLDLTLLTLETGPHPEAHILGKAGPHKSGGQKPPRSLCTRMEEAMKSKEQLMT